MTGEMEYSELFFLYNTDQNKFNLLWTRTLNQNVICPMH